MTIVFASHTYLEKCFVVDSHHLARNSVLAGRRAFYFYLSPPDTPIHLAKIGERETN